MNVRAETLRRSANLRGAVLALAVIVVWSVLLGGMGTVGAAFTGPTINPANSFTADVLDPTGSFSASRPCTALVPAYRASTTDTTIGGSSLTLTTPTTATGDRLVMSVMAYNSGGSSVPTINTPTGWTALGGDFSDGANYDIRLAVFTRAAPSSPPADYSVSFSTIAAATATLTSYSGVAGLTMWSSRTGTTSTAATSDLTASAANELLVGVVAHSGTSSSTPAGMTASVSVNGTGAGLHQYHEVRAAGATGTRSSTISATNPAWVTLTILIKSAGKDPTVNLSWTVTPDTWASDYEIIRSPGSATTVSGRSTIAWSDTTTTAATSYTYTISAAYGAWRSTTRSASVNAC
jgi:hypothetical protein